jgi:hypothetical protein
LPEIQTGALDMSNSTGKAAVAGVIASALDAAVAEAEAMQLDMLPGLAGSSRLPDETKAEIVAAVKRKPGRPPGATNLVQRDMLQFIRRVFGDPLEGRARWLMYEPAQLAQVLGCTTAEAFDRQDRIRADLSKLYYAPLAAVDDGGNAVVPRFTMVLGGQNALARDASGAPRPPWEYDLEHNEETQQNQGFLASGDGVSHGKVSHGDE